MLNTEQLCYQTEKINHQRFSIKTLFLKILQYWRDPCEIFKKTYFEEHLQTAASELNLQSILWNFVSRLHLKTSRLSNITKIPVTFILEL